MPDMRQAKWSSDKAAGVFAGTFMHSDYAQICNCMMRVFYRYGKTDAQRQVGVSFGSSKDLCTRTVAILPESRIVA
jgi:hypothetical protein